MVVPPTAVTYGSEPGNSVPGPSEYTEHEVFGSSAPQSPLLK
jgi:hypothetical protein